MYSINLYHLFAFIIVKIKINYNITYVKKRYKLGILKFCVEHKYKLILTYSS